ncbi:MAG: hypothetical protein IT311_06655 [Anaerolineales bacterium]|nr:hypothetical protein [Anaerolineales bacterium]MCZ2123275.1 hypothetical protein [Anaerolineales bacterium]
MQPRIKLGLAIGAVGLVLNICVAGFMGVCGPIVSLIAGGVAGYLTAQQEKLSAKGNGAKAGAIAGGIAGGLVIIGQLIGGVAALALIQVSGVSTIFGQAPITADTAGTFSYYIGGLGTGVCIGLFGAILAAGAGAGVGYAATSDQPKIETSSTQ